MSLLNYTSQGTGSPVVFLHGFLEDLTMWERITPNFQQHQIICIDLPGHGKSPITKNETMATMAQKVNDLLESLHVENPIIIGHSMGGYVGLELLKIRSLAHLVLFYSNFWEDTPEKKHNRTRVIRILELNKEIFIREAIPNLFNPDTKNQFQTEIEQLIENAISIPNENIIEATKGLRDRIDHAPTINKYAKEITMIHGEKDPIISNEELVLNLNRLAHRPHLISMPDCGHMGHIEQLDEVLLHLRKIIKS